MVSYLLVVSWTDSPDVSANTLKRFISSKTLNSCLVTGHVKLVVSGADSVAPLCEVST